MGERDQRIRGCIKKIAYGIHLYRECLFQKKEFQAAEEYYRKAIKKEPENADAYNNLAWLYVTEKENLGEAEQLAIKAIELNPSKKDIYQDTLDQIRAARTHPTK